MAHHLIFRVQLPPLPRNTRQTVRELRLQFTTPGLAVQDALEGRRILAGAIEGEPLDFGLGAELHEGDHLHDEENHDGEEAVVDWRGHTKC